MKLTSESLQARIDAAFAGVETGMVVIGASASGRRAFAAIGAGPDAPERRFRVGCATKLFVAALLEKKLAERNIGLDVPLRRLVQWPHLGALLDSTTLRHLLEHTHGVVSADAADSRTFRDCARKHGAAPDAGAAFGTHPPQVAGVPSPSRRCNGRSTRFARPGRWYSYSSFGACVLASFLEELEGRPFAELLNRELLEPLGIRRGVAPDAASAARTATFGPDRGRSAAAAVLCPATGGVFELGVSEMLDFLDAQFGHRHDAEPVTPLPGWHPLELGIRLGWKYYGGGGFGHQSVWPGASLWLRVWPHSRVSLVIASERHPAAIVAARALGPAWPELRGRPLPRCLTEREARQVDVGAYRGLYALGAEQLRVDTGACGLTLSGEGFRTALIPARERVFFMAQPPPGRTFVQFLPRGRRESAGLWDGRCVYPSFPIVAGAIN